MDTPSSLPGTPQRGTGRILAGKLAYDDGSLLTYGMLRSGAKIFQKGNKEEMKKKKSTRCRNNTRIRRIYSVPVGQPAPELPFSRRQNKIGDKYKPENKQSKRHSRRPPVDTQHAKSRIDNLRQSTTPKWKPYNASSTCHPGKAASGHTSVFLTGYHWALGLLSSNTYCAGL